MRTWVDVDDGASFHRTRMMKQRRMKRMKRMKRKRGRKKGEHPFPPQCLQEMFVQLR